MLLDPAVEIDPKTGLEWMNTVCPEVGPCPTFSTGFVIPKQPNQSMYDSILYYYRQIGAADAHLTATDAFAATSIPLRIVTAEWLNVSHIVECELMRLDYAQETTQALSFESLQKELFVLHMWRRRCTRYAEILERTAAMCCERGRKMWKRADQGKSIATERTADFLELVRSFERMSKRVEKQITAVSARISVEIGKQSVVEAHRITRLTIVALVFFPLSFVAGLFSMNDQFSLNSTRAWVFFVVATPLTVIVTFAGLYWHAAREPPKRVLQTDEYDSTMLGRIPGMSY
jgi:hypothetical protein